MTTVDSVLLWLRATAARLAYAARGMTIPERVLSAVLGAMLAAALGWQVFAPDWISLIVLGSLVVAHWLFAAVLADAVIVRENLKRSGAAMIKLNAAKPSGAPRVAEVACRHGDPHRYVYGPTGWEAAGPAVEHRPTSEEATTP